MAEQKFEKDLERLEQLVEALEGGGLSLDDALRRFEEGIKLARRCEKTLSEAERKIEMLTKNAQGEIVTEPFGDNEDTSISEGEESVPQETSPKTPTSSRATKKPASDIHSEETEEEGGLLF